MASKTSRIPKQVSSSGRSTITIGRDPEFEAIIDDTTFSAGVATVNVGLRGRQSASDSDLPAVHVSDIGGSSVTSPQTVTVTTTQVLPGTGFRVNEKLHDGK